MLKNVKRIELPVSKRKKQKNVGENTLGLIIIQVNFAIYLYVVVIRTDQ